MKTLVVLMLVLVGAQQPGSGSLRGTWTASVGPTPAFHGTWTADLQAQTPNTATGSWTLLDASNRVVAQGTWSALKSPRTWSGTWSARVMTGGGGDKGRLMSGSWRADIPSGASAGSTFSDMLRSTLQKQLTGAWHSGGRQGRWWLTASP
jgi:hypothetical protein